MAKRAAVPPRYFVDPPHQSRRLPESRKSKTQARPPAGPQVGRPGSERVYRGCIRDRSCGSGFCGSDRDRDAAGCPC